MIVFLFFFFLLFAFAFNDEGVIAERDVDVLSFDTGHVKRNFQIVFRFADIQVGVENTGFVSAELF